MNKFLKKTIILLGGVAGLIFLLISATIIFNSNNHIDYPTAIRGKYARLDSLKHTKKIIICGGSSSSYSINSQLLETTFQTPVVNTSLAMSLGSKFQLNLVKDYLHKGDIILYIPEYEFYYGNENGDDFLYTTAFFYPKVINDFTLNQKATFIKKAVTLTVNYFVSLIKKQFEGTQLVDKQYNAASYNSIGDNISLTEVKKTKIKEDPKNRYQKLRNHEPSAKFISFLKKMNTECIEGGVNLVVTFPPIEQSQYDKRFLTAINIVKRKTGIQFIGNPADYVYQYQYFYDSSYHLNGLGRKLRTQNLLIDLKKLFN